MLTGAVPERLKEIVLEITDKFGITILEQETDKDHIHILFSSKPSVTLSKFINSLKSVSSRLIRKEFPEVKKELWEMLSGLHLIFLHQLEKFHLMILKNM